MTPKKTRRIELLRKEYPGRWTYDHWRCLYEHESGRIVRAYARCAPRYDGDDDSFISELRWEDTGELAINPFFTNRH